MQDRTTIPYQRAFVEGAEDVEAYGLDASPALSVIAGALGAVGPKPDLVLSGINDGVNVGRSVLHSGTVGAALTASQLGISALAVSLRVGEGPDPWESAADLAVALIPLLAGCAAPHRAEPQRAAPAGGRDPRRALGPGERGGAHQVRPGLGVLGGAEPRGDRGSRRGRSGALGHGGRARGEGRDRAHGRVPVPPFAATSAWPTPGPRTPRSVAQGYAALTALRGPRADEDAVLLGRLDAGLGSALAAFDFAD